MTAPRPKDALELKPCPFCNTAPAFGRMIEPDQVTIGCNNDGCLVQLCVVSDVESEAVKAWNTRATFQPDGERREAIARIERAASFYRGMTDTAVYSGKHVANILETVFSLASGLVQNEAGWRDISTAPKDGKPVLIYVPINQPDRRVLTAYWTESEWWICSGSVVLGKPTNWKPLPTPPAIRSARNGGAS